jgi:hypothetical protein
MITPEEIRARKVAYTRKWRAANIEHVRNYHREYQARVRLEHPERHRRANRKYKAKLKAAQASKK